MLDDLKFIHQRDKNDLLGQASRRLRQSDDFLDGQIAGWQPEIAAENNLAKQLALELIGRSVVIYAGPRLQPAIHVWKQAINQNAKQVAWCGELSQAEFAGWSQQPVDKPYAIVELRSSLDEKSVQEFFEQSNKLLSGRRPVANIVQVEGADLGEQLSYAKALGEFVSIYLSLASNIDPSDSAIIDKLKDRMEK